MTQHSRPEGAFLETTRTRREIIRLGFTGIVTLVGLGSGLSGKVFGSVASSAHSSPALEEGPYWINETTSRFHRADLRANLDGSNLQPGLPLHLGLTVSYIHNGKVMPLPHAFVYLWSTNAVGVYSGEQQENTLQDTYMRGYQVTNAQGYVQFTTLYPGWYGGRTIHIHARIRTYPKNDPTQKPTYDFETQLFFDDAVSDHIIATVSPYNSRPGRDTTNTVDHVYTGPSLDGTLAKNAGTLMQMTVRTKSRYATAQMPVILDLSKHTRSGGFGGPPPGGGPPGDWGDGPPPPPPGGFGGPPQD